MLGKTGLPPEISVVLPVSPEDAFALLTEPERLRRWKTVTARVDLRAGGSYRWTIIPGHAVAGTFIEVQRGRRLVFGWGWEGQPDLGPDASTVTITFEPAPGGTLVRLVHTGLSEEQAASHLAGWTHYFGRLSTAAVAGDAGADDWAAVPDPMTDLACAEAALAMCQRALRRLGSDADGPALGAQSSAAQLVDHLVESLTQLAVAANVAVVDPGAGVGAEPRVADLGQQAFEGWGARGERPTVRYRGAEAPAELVLAFAAVELLTHAIDIGTAAGWRPEISAPVSAHLRRRAAELAAYQTSAGRPLAEHVLVGPDADLLARLDANVPAD